jgi:aminomuconate-semialdehyde/2-hydroxymuconate-6-semialdehyde dehydrogenase
MQESCSQEALRLKTLIFAFMQQILNFINGVYIKPVSENYLPNFNPATGKVYSELADSDERDVQLAYEAAKKALNVWSGYTQEQRSDILLRIAKGIEKKSEEFVQAETDDQGKPLWLSRVMDIPRAVSNFKFYATAALSFNSEFHQTDAHTINYTLRSPLGVVGCISPWNLPLYLFTWKIAPALAMGNCVVAKPSEITPMTASMLGAICNEAGMPPGVLNIVHGLGQKVGSAITKHPGITAISFTGGTKTGMEISSIAAPMFKKMSLELGGKNPNLVFEDCSFEKAVKTSVAAAFTNQGEICLCGSRIFVQKTIFEKFRDAFIAETKKRTVGDPLLDTTRVGAIVSKVHFEKILDYIELAKNEGGKILLGGEVVKPEGRCQEGWFISPTVIEGLKHDCRVNQEEIFGPVVTLVPFENEQEAIMMANSTPYGLAATVWTENLSRAHRIAAALESGIVWINCWLERDLRTPFGGVKQSGVGREGGMEALKFFTEEKNVCIRI